MANMQHTPGPWDVTIDGYGDGELHLSVFIPDKTQDLEEAFQEAEAKARMIAASPEMLDALNAAAELINYALPKFDWGKSALDGKAIQLLNEVPMVVRTAIAKATGQI